MIGIDTFSWLKIIRLYESDWTSFVLKFLDDLDLFISYEGKREFDYRFPKYLFLLEKVSILPVLNKVYRNYLENGFDANDASILEYAEEKKFRIITEDKPMLTEGISKRKNIIQLIDFFYELHKGYGYLTEKDFYLLVKKFRKWRNITKKKEKYYLKN